MSRLGRTLEERFWEKVNRNGPTPQHVRGIGCCWIWTAHKTDGYGRLQVSTKGLPYKSQVASRISWQLAYGPVPKGKCVCHACDNRACVRPSHLFVGTIADNNLDMYKKCRSTAPSGDRHMTKLYPELIKRGEDKFGSKLTAKDVKHIRQRYAKGGITYFQLADKYGVSFSLIHRVVRRLCWRHL